MQPLGHGDYFCGDVAHHQAQRVWARSGPRKGATAGGQKDDGCVEWKAGCSLGPVKQPKTSGARAGDATVASSCAGCTERER